MLSFSWLTVKVVDTAADMRYGAVFRETQGLLAEPDVESFRACSNRCETAWISIQFGENCTPGPCFPCVRCMPSCFNAHWQFIPLLSLLTLIFSITPFAWLYSILLTPYFRWVYHSLFMPTVLGMQLGCKTRAGCTLKGWRLYFWPRQIVLCVC